MRYIRNQDNQYLFLTFPDLKEFPSGDVFSKHPTKSANCKQEDSLDDNIVLAVERNVDSWAFKEHGEMHPAVESATVIGDGRPPVFETNLERGGNVDWNSEVDKEVSSIIQKASQGASMSRCRGIL